MRQKVLCVVFLLLLAVVLTGSGGVLLRGQYRQFRQLERWVDTVAETYVRNSDPKLWNEEDLKYFENVKDKQTVIEYLISRIGPSNKGRASAMILAGLFGLSHDVSAFSNRDRQWWQRYQRDWRIWWQVQKGSIRWNPEDKVVMIEDSRLARNPGLRGLLPLDNVDPI